VLVFLKPFNKLIRQEELMPVKKGNTVKVHYTGKLENGQVFDSSESRDPLEVTVGSGRVIPGFEQGIIGMEPGEKKTIKLSPQEAYGPKRDDLVVDVNKGDFPEHIDPHVGQNLQIQQPDGQVVNVRVADVEEEKVTLDANHPLAGEPLEFDVELVEIKS
jgi:peptidylprolyl isomerase